LIEETKELSSSFDLSLVRELLKHTASSGQILEETPYQKHKHAEVVGLDITS
jgi:hypothetical protein